MVTLLLVSIAVFLLARATGDPVKLMAPDAATQEEIDRIRSHLGLDKPYYVQYFRFISQAARGDFGDSIRGRRPVIRLIADRYPASLSLAAVAFGFALTMSFPLGMLAAVRQGTWLDSMARGIVFVAMATPSFWFGIMLIQLVSVTLGLLPAGGYGGFAYHLLPGLTLSHFLMAGLMRLLRSSAIDVLRNDYITFARLKGLSERAVIWKHVLRNAMIPVVTLAGVHFAMFVSLGIVVETVFAWPGVGRLTYEAILFRDFPVIQAVVLMGAALMLVVNLLVDITYAWLDPRIRY